MKSRVGWKTLRGVLLALLGGGFSFFLLYVGLSEDRSPGDRNSRDWREADGDVRMEGIHFKEWENGVLVWVLNAREGKYYHGMQQGVFQDVALTFVPSSGGQMTLFSDRVVYELDRRALRADGNVRGESDEGYRFHTDSLYCDVERREVESVEKVTLNRDRLTAEGIGMKGSMRDQSFVLLSSVRTVFLPEKEVK